MCVIMVELSASFVVVLFGAWEGDGTSESATVDNCAWVGVVVICAMP